MSEKEKKIIEELADKLPAMSERERGYLEGTIAKRWIRKMKRGEERLVGIFLILLGLAIAKAIYWKLCFKGVLLYMAECGNALPDINVIKKYAKKVALKGLHIKDEAR